MGKLTNTVSGNVASFRSADKANIESLKIHFLPVQEGSGDASPTNIRNIIGWTQCTLHKEGKNLIDLTKLTGTNAVWWKGNVITGYSNHCVTPLIPVKPGGTYTLNRNSYQQSYVSTFDKDKTYINQFVWDNYRPTQTIGDDVYYIGITIGTDYLDDPYPQLEFSSGYTNYVPYVQGEEFPVSWSEQGTLYGGYVDIVKGKLIAEYAMYGLAWKDWELGAVVGDNTRKTFSIGYSPYNYPIFDGGTIKTTASRCNVSNTYLNSNSSDTVHFYINSTGKVLYATLPNDMDENTVVQISSVLAEPIEYDLTSADLQTFLDHNNFWSDTNDITEVEYDVIDHLAKRKFAMNTPHIETETGDIASFNTDMKAPIQECKVSFTPIQNGSGDPYPPGATAQIWDEEWEQGYYDANGEKVASTSMFRNKNLIPVTPNTTYAFVGKENTVVGWRRYDANGNCLGMSCNSSGTSTAQTYGFSFTTDADTHYMAFFVNNSGTYANDISFNYPATDTTYHKYSNVRPISGFSECRVFKARKNLLNINPSMDIFNINTGYNKKIRRDLVPGALYKGVTSNNYWIGSSSTRDISSIGYDSLTFKSHDSAYGFGVCVAVKPGKKYQFCCAENSDVGFRIGEYDIQGNHLKSSNLTASQNPVLTVSANTYYLMVVIALSGTGPTNTFVTMSDIYMSLYDDGTEYEAFDGETLSVTFPAIKNLIANSALYQSGNQFFISAAQSSFPFHLSVGTYTLSNTTQNAYAYYKKTDGNGIMIHDNQTNHGTFTIAEEGDYQIWYYQPGTSTSDYANIQLEDGSAVTAYEPYGTIYGGYVDLITGELWKTYENRLLSSCYFWMPSDGSFSCDSQITFNDRSKILCNVYKTVEHSYWYQMEDLSIMGTPDTSSNIFRIYDSNYTDVNSFTAHLAEIGATMVYQIPTPILVATLTPQQIKSLKGSNNFWSDTNGNVTVKYWKH